MTRKQQLISVVIPCFRQARFLTACVESLQAQTYTTWEAIIVNDGSPDNTREVASALQQKDSRVRYREQPNAGVASARNAGVSAATGQLLQFLDADDLLPPEKLAHGASIMAKAPLDFCFGDYAFLEPDGTLMSNEFCSPTFLTECPILELVLRWGIDLSIPIHSFLFRLDFLSENGLNFDVRLHNNEDWSLWLDILRCKPNFQKLDGQTAIYRRNPASVTADRQRIGAGFLRAIDLQLQRPCTPQLLRDALRIKRELVRYNYGFSARGKFASWLELPWIRVNVPWVVQSALRRDVTVDQRARAYSALRRLRARDQP
jgi:glycosyltransferase involved in cell wall biosynthesis